MKPDPVVVVAEAADVANMAMMVADHFREGGPSKDSGREPTPLVGQSSGAAFSVGDVLRLVGTLERAQSLTEVWTKRCAEWRAASRVGGPENDIARAYEIAASELDAALAGTLPPPSARNVQGSCTCPEEHETHLVGCPLNCGEPGCSSCDQEPR